MSSRASPLVAPRERGGLLALDRRACAPAICLEAEERYVELFDRGRATSLNLFEHLHGDGRERGDAMVELKRLYERAGFRPVDKRTAGLPAGVARISELSRHRREHATCSSDCAHILRQIAEALLARGSAYAAVLQALLVIAGEQPARCRQRCRKRATAARRSRPRLVRAAGLCRGRSCQARAEPAGQRIPV